MSEKIHIKGAKQNNLQNISVSIKKNKLITISGVSGSGKSTLAFDTLYAEGQRRYIESLSSYARQFLGKLEKPKVDEIIGICPAIAIEQKTTTNNPRSTISTSSEIYDYLKLLFARIGKTYSPISKKLVKKEDINDVISFVKKIKEGTKFFILSKKNVENINRLIQEGYNRIYYKNKIVKIDEIDDEKLEKNILVVIDRLVKGQEGNKERLTNSIETAFQIGKGKCTILVDKTIKTFSNQFELDGIKFVEPSTNLFSFNSPFGACKNCEGYGAILGIDPKKVINNSNLSIYQGAVACWNGTKLVKWKEKFISNSMKYNFPIHKPYKNLSTEEKDLLWNGKEKCKGIHQFFNKLEEKKYKIQNRVLIARYRGKRTCDSCNGSRLRKEALYVKIGGKNISEINDMSIKRAIIFFQELKLQKIDYDIAKRILIEITNRLNYINEVGLGYLTLNRKSNSLSGGESQRINIATSLSTSLVGAMYILDEPSIGLHSSDTEKLLKILKELRDIGNTVILVEHDEQIITESDEIIDIGPKAGINGGKIIFQGNKNKLLIEKKSLTAQYLSGVRKIQIPNERRKLRNYFQIKNISLNNLVNLNAKIPLEGLVLVTGVSGSGKSTLVKEIIHPIIKNYFDTNSNDKFNLDNLIFSSNCYNKIEFISQNPIGKSSRSNAVTYLKIFDDIRKLFSNEPLSKSRGYKSSYYSFNVDGGRCVKCKGEGEITIEMQFMADVYLKCDECNGTRFKKEILEIKFGGKNISDILNLSIEESIHFFNQNDKKNISQKIQPLFDVGLGYIKLGQSSNTLSGGEAQRIKLAQFLGKGVNSDKTIFLFDEPTTGLHFYDIEKLLSCFNKLIEKGHSIICIEHNMDVIKCADWIIDLGPEGGENGGQIIFEGTPDKIIHHPNSLTGKYLKEKL